MKTTVEEIVIDVPAPPPPPVREMAYRITTDLRGMRLIKGLLWSARVHNQDQDEQLHELLQAVERTGVQYSEDKEVEDLVASLRLPKRGL